jgi:anti-anti-sigma factor
MDLSFCALSQSPEEGDMNTQSTIMVTLPETFGSKEARRLGRELKNRIVKKSASSVVVDLSRVRLIDLAGIEGLLDCMEAVAENDGSLQLGKVSPEAATLLELTRLDQLFQKFPSCETPAVFSRDEVASDSEEVVVDKIVQPQPVAA